MSDALVHVLLWTLKASAMGSVLVLFILLLKNLLRGKLTAKWTYWLWLLLVLRLLLPWTPESSFSLFNIISVERFVLQLDQQQAASGSDIAVMPQSSHAGEPMEQAGTDLSSIPTMPTNNTQGTEQNGAVDSAVGNQVSDQATTAPFESGEQTVWLERNASAMALFIQIASYVWLVGALLVLGILLFTNIRFAAKVKRESIITDPDLLKMFQSCKETMGIRRRVVLIRSQQVPIATLSGIFSSKLLLPDIVVQKLNDDELRFLFLHELSHVKRNDIAINGIMNILLALHWFNPLLWYAYYKMREDQELACDALALAHIPPEKTQAYGFTLIKLLEIVPDRAILTSTVHIADNKKALHKRIVHIKLFKKVGYKSALLGIAVLLVLSGCTLTSSKIGVAQPSTSPSAPSENESAQTAQSGDDDRTDVSQQNGEEVIESSQQSGEKETDVSEQIAELADIWANALKTRDGQPRYEMMSESMQQKFVQEQINRSGENWNFVIGDSSPWVVDYNIELEGMSATITYLTQTSMPASYNSQETISFKLEHGQLLVDDYTVAFEHRELEPNGEGHSTAVNEDKISLFGNESFTPYDEAEVVTIQFDNQNFETKFRKVRHYPFGFYMPSNMEEYSFHDGEEWGYDQDRNHVTFHNDGNIDDTLQRFVNWTNEELSIYEEYAGSEKQYDTINDYFVVKDGDESYLLRFYYFEEERDYALPLFLKFAATMRYVAP